MLMYTECNHRCSSSLLQKCVISEPLQAENERLSCILSDQLAVSETGQSRALSLLQ